MNSYDSNKIEEAIKVVLQNIDKDSNRDGLIDTPARISRFLKEFYNEEKFTMTTFDNEGYNDMVVQKSITFYSMCEHHMLPFFGTGTIAYIPKKKIVGLSKLARTLDHFSRRLQNQERITNQVAEYLNEKLDPEGVAVVITARHLCMEMRGVQKPGTFTTTSAVLGQFKDNPTTRSEFLNLIR